MTLTKLFNDCYEAMKSSIKDELDSNVLGGVSAYASVNTEQGYIDLFMDKYGNKSVVVCHDNESEHECPLIAKAIEAMLPDWDAVVEEWEEENQVEDMWQSHGFADEADYLHWRYG